MGKDDSLRAVELLLAKRIERAETRQIDEDERIERRIEHVARLVKQIREVLVRNVSGAGGYLDGSGRSVDEIDRAEEADRLSRLSRPS